MVRTYRFRDQDFLAQIGNFPLPTVYDYSTAALIGTGILKNKVIPHQNAYPLSIPVEWSYVGVNASDITWLE